MSNDSVSVSSASSAINSPRQTREDRDTVGRTSSGGGGGAGGLGGVPHTPRPDMASKVVLREGVGGRAGAADLFAVPEVVGEQRSRGVSTPLPMRQPPPLASTIAYSPCAPHLLTLCPAPTDPVDQSWPRGTGSVGDSVGEDSDSVGEDSHPIAHLARTHKMCDWVRVLDAMLYAQGDAVHAFSLRLGMCLLVCLLCSPYLRD